MVLIVWAPIIVDVHCVRVIGILGACGCPEQALGEPPASRNLAKSIAEENFLEALIDNFGIRNGDFAL